MRKKKTTVQKSESTYESPFSSDLDDLLSRIESILSDHDMFWKEDGNFGVDTTDLEWVDQLVQAAKLAKRYAKISVKNVEIENLIESIRETLIEDDDDD